MPKLAALIASTILWTAGFPFALYTPDLIPGPLSALVIWVALVPMILALRNASPGVRFRWGFLFGFFSIAGVFFWIIVALRKYGGLSIPLSMGIMGVMAVVLACFPATGFWLYPKLSRRVPPWLAGAVVFAFLQWTLNYIPAGGFPWGSPGYSLAHALPLIQIGDLVGINGLNFLICLGNFVAAEAIGGGTARSRRWGRWTLLSLLCASLLYGALRIRQEEEAIASSPRLRAALLQGNVAQDVKWDETQAVDILSHYVRLSGKAAEEKPDLIVWSESAWPFLISDQTKIFPVLQGAGGDASFLIGISTWSKTADRLDYRNSAFFIGPDGRSLSRYDKERLVPFGEYVPLARYVPWIRRFVPSVAGSFAEAERGLQLPVLKGQPFSVLICYEVLFPELAAERVRRGARFFVNITNDAWFDRTSGPFQHVNFGAFRAVETRRPILRAANTGITTWFDSIGRSHDRTALFTEAVLQAEIAPREGETFYVRFPYLFPGILTLALLALLLAHRKSFGGA